MHKQASGSKNNILGLALEYMLAIFVVFLAVLSLHLVTGKIVIDPQEVKQEISAHLIKVQQEAVNIWKRFGKANHR